MLTVEAQQGVKRPSSHQAGGLSKRQHWARRAVQVQHRGCMSSRRHFGSPQRSSAAAPSQLPAIRSALLYPESRPSKLSPGVWMSQLSPQTRRVCSHTTGQAGGHVPLRGTSQSRVLDSACVNVPLALRCTAGLPSSGPAISVELLVLQLLCL